MIYKPKNFALVELVDYSTFIKYGTRSWQFLDERLLRTIQWVRDTVGVPLTINNWHTGGNRPWSGLRTPESPWYRPMSQHTMGRAVDIVCTEYNGQELRDIVAKTWRLSGYYWPITMEENVNWLHLDNRVSDNLINYFSV